MDRASIHIINAVVFVAVLALVGFCLWNKNELLQLIFFGGTLASSVVFYFCTGPDRGTDNLVLRSGKDFHDLGTGRIFLGVCDFYYEKLTYNHSPKQLTKSIRLPTKDGSVLTATMGVSWRVDPAHLLEYFTLEHEARIEASAKQSFEAWSKKHLPAEIYFGTPPEIAPVPGILLSPTTLTDIDSDDGAMTYHIRDNSQLISSILAEVKDEDRIEATRAELKKDYPDRAERIDRLCDQRKWVLQKRGIGDNR